MFRSLPPAVHDPRTLSALGRAQVQPLEDGRLDKALGEEDDDENTSRLPDGSLRLPAGYTYFGQFVDHDITFDPVSSLTRQNDPDALTDFRTPAFDLDNLYGRGPSDQPYLYEADGLHLRLGDRVAGDPQVAGPDLMRIDGRAVIGDPRNDENLIVSGLQSVFLRFHNAVLDAIKAEQPGLSDPELFKRAQQCVRWHYQWVVIHDFLPRLVGDGTVDDILQTTEYEATEGVTASFPRPRLLFYRYREHPYMPLEFSVAAYRYGHSVIRPSYKINDVIPLPVDDRAARIPLFSSGGPLTNLNGFRPLPQQWGIQWKYFLADIKVDRPGADDRFLPQPSYKLDATISNPLGALPPGVSAPELLIPGEPSSIAQVLAVRNLLRGLRLGLPSGQAVAAAIGLRGQILGDDELYDGLGLSQDALADLAGNAPLWFYILKESELRCDSAHLGPVGGRIVAEVLIGLLDGDHSSFLHVEPGWRPTLPSKTEGHFTLSDLVNFGVSGGTEPASINPAPESEPAPPEREPAWTA